IADLIRPRLPRPTIFDPAPLHQTARWMMDRYRPVLPFTLTIVEVPRLRLRLVHGEEMTWRHLAASCSIPAAFPPVRLGDSWYVDGGLLGALPLWVAAELGADRAVAVDALPRLPSRVLASGAALLRKVSRPRRPPAHFPVMLIRPGRPLGTLRDAVYWN